LGVARGGIRTASTGQFSASGLHEDIRRRDRNAENGEVEIRFPFHRSLTQQNDFVHAGAITSILDSACGYAALSVAPLDHDVLSIEFKVNFLSPAVGEEFCARSHVKRAGKNLIVCAADAFALKNGQEKLVATMLATIMAVKHIA
jgi:uncharacterized protein (TIGR00369 family)